jgi:hypothetical protein
MSSKRSKSKKSQTQLNNDTKTISITNEKWSYSLKNVNINTNKYYRCENINTHSTKSTAWYWKSGNQQYFRIHQMWQYQCRKWACNSIIWMVLLALINLTKAQTKFGLKQKIKIVFFSWNLVRQDYFGHIFKSLYRLEKKTKIISETF